MSSWSIGGARPWSALVGLMLAVLVVSMDGTILSVASPTLATALHASESQLQWFSSGYLLVLAATVLPVGRLGDRVGRKKVLVLSIAVFGAGSLGCALSRTPEEFLTARLVMGVAGSGVTVMALSVLAILFDESERPKAVGVFSGVNFLALPLGPVLGGWLLTHFWWGWVFIINAPVATVALVVAAILIPESRAHGRISFDAIGIAISTAGLVGVTYGLIEAGQNGWTNLQALEYIALGLIALLGFVIWERRVMASGGQPLLALPLFRSSAFAWGALLTGVVGLSMIGVLFVMPQFFQGVLGTTAIDSGLRLLPMLAGLVLGAIGADPVARHVGWRFAVATGFVLMAASAAAGAMTDAASGYWFISAWMFVFGAGIGLALATSSSAALSTLTRDDSGAGSAIVQLLQKLSAPFGSAILGSVLSAVYVAHLNGLPRDAASVAGRSVFAGAELAKQTGSRALLVAVRNAFTTGLGASLLISAGIAVVGALLAILFLPGRREMRRTLNLVSDIGGSVLADGGD